MNDNTEFDKVGRDPRFVSNLKKRKRPVNEEDEADDRFATLKKQTKTYKDKRGRPWVKNPLEYAKDVLQTSNADKLENNEDESGEEDSYEESMEGSVTEREQSGDASSSDEGSDDAGPAISMGNEEFTELDWETLTKDANIVENATYRLAVLHFDWDKSKAEDLFLLLESFLPKGGSIKKITVYPSQFGIERMTEEGEQGPRELRTGVVKSDTTSNDNEEEDNEGPSDRKTRRLIREYQLSRLKYFYGIIEFDSVASASTVYDECDGIEYESSGVRLDLRFVDDLETFETPSDWRHLESSISGVDRSAYVPKKFETSALRSTSLSVTWDETPKERTDWLRQGFEVEDFDKEIDEAMLRKYVAFSSEEEDSEIEDEESNVTGGEDKKRKKVPHLSSAQARALLLESSGSKDLDIKASSEDEGDEAPCAIVSSGDEEEDDNRTGRQKNGMEALQRQTSQPTDKTSKAKKRIKRRELAKEKLKKKKEKDNMISELWADEDDRFDEFLTNPIFSVSNTHPDFKEARDFLSFIRQRGKKNGTIVVSEEEDDLMRTNS